jgi:beta-galactosidase
MKKTLAFILLLSGFVSAQERTVTILKNGWKFQLGNTQNAHAEKFDDTKWQSVSVPHDWAISGPFIPDGDGNTGKLPWKGEGWYRLKFSTPETDTEKRFILLFDGVMTQPKVYVNGQKAGGWDYGYNSFYLDVTSLLKKKGENILAVYADTRQHDSRWYPGAGIYRKVSLIAYNPVHTEIWGTQVQTAILKPHYADLLVRSFIKNESLVDKKIQVLQKIFKNGKYTSIAASTEINLRAGQSKNAENTFTINNPDRWSLESPNLYSAETSILENGKVLDISRTDFGIRDIRITPDNGLYLNDQRVQLKGVNLHSDLGPLGMAFDEKVFKRQLIIMKNMGCNAIRTSHNVPAPEVLELCDQMGLLVYNEAFDKYDAKADISDTTNFDAFAQRNISNFIRRDRNHPSVFIWSVGNEMADQQLNLNGGFEKLQTMINYVKKYDPTRPVTMACDIFPAAKTRHFDFYDIHSWNYGRRYSLARQMEPNKSVIVSESASTISSRGYYEFPLPKDKTQVSNALQMSSYDLNAPYWAEISDDDFMWQQDEPYIAGEFVWTGIDYLGEPTPYTNDWAKEKGLPLTASSRSSYFGIVDLCGIPKDRYYLYKSYWNTTDTTLHILPHWNWPERVGQITPVFVYTSGDCAELFINGVSQGKKCKNPKSENSVDRFRLMWENVTYQPGEIKVVAYKNGEILDSKTIATTADPNKVKITQDKVLKEKSDYYFFELAVTDNTGRECPTASNIIKISLKGDANIAGIDNGNPQNFQSFRSESIPLFNGKAMVILKSETGKFEITASSEGLGEDKQIRK